MTDSVATYDLINSCRNFAGNPTWRSYSGTPNARAFLRILTATRPGSPSRESTRRKGSGECFRRDPRICVSSPMPRCVDTARAILRGTGWPGEESLDRRLGVPGPFVVDPKLAGPLFLELGSVEVVRRQLAYGDALPGMRPTSEGVEYLLGLVTRFIECQGRFNVYITHDSILAAVVGYLFEMRLNDIGWPDYMEGLLLWRSKEYLHLAWRDLKQTFHPFSG